MLTIATNGLAMLLPPLFAGYNTQHTMEIVLSAQQDSNQGLSTPLRAPTETANGNASLDSPPLPSPILPSPSQPVVNACRATTDGAGPPKPFANSAVSAQHKSTQPPIQHGSPTGHHVSFDDTVQTQDAQVQAGEDDLAAGDSKFSQVPACLPCGALWCHDYSVQLHHHAVLILTAAATAVTANLCQALYCTWPPW